MVRNYKRTSTRGSWDKDDMTAAVNEVKEGRMSFLGAANSFKVPEATLRRRLKKNEEEIPVHGGRFRDVFNEEQLADLKKYLTVMDRMFFGMTKLQCRRLVFDFAESCKIKHPFNQETKMAGENWIFSFMNKFKFSLRKPEATSIASAMGFNKPSVDKFFSILKGVREKYKFPACAIYNADDSGLSTVPNKLPKVISPIGTKRVSKIVSAERGRTVTIICCISATGFYLPPFLVFARKRMRDELVQRAPPGTVGHCSDNGWSNADIFLKFLQHFALHVVRPSDEAHVLLLVDNHKTHITLNAINFCRDNRIVMVGFPPHTTHRLQPLFVSMFGPLKTYFSQACDNFMVSHPGQVINDYLIGELLSTAYFKAATIGNAVNGFKECEIEPYNSLVFNDDDFAAAKPTDKSLKTDHTTDESYDLLKASDDLPENSEKHLKPLAQNDGQVDVTIEISSCIEKGREISVFDIQPVPKSNCESKRKGKQKQSSTVINSTPVKNSLEEREKEKAEQDYQKNKKKEERQLKKGLVKKLKFEGKPPIKTEIKASSSKESAVTCPVCDELYSDPPTEDWIKCSKCHKWWHENCSNYEGGQFICDLC